MIQRLVLPIVGLLILLLAVLPLAAQPLAPGYQPDSFVVWDPQPVSYSYADLALSDDRRRQLETDSTPLVYRLRQIEIRLAGSGAVEQNIVRSNAFITDSGVQGAGNMTFWVDAFSEQAVIEEAYTLLPDGRRVPVDAQTIQLLPDSSDDIFSDAFEVVVPFPALDAGAITVLRYRIVQKPDTWPLPWSRIYYPRLGTPTEEFAFSLRWDDGGDAPAWRTDFDALSCTEAANALTCRALEIPAYPSDPHVQYLDVMPQIAVAEASSWMHLAGAVGELFETAVAPDQALSAKVDDLLGDSADPEEQLDRLHRFVSQKIRYVGLEHGLGGIVPRPAARTLERRFGDCKDKTALFVALAREAGFEAYPVLTSINRFAPDKLLLPAASYFNHMVGCARLEDGREFCVDLTDPYSSLRLAAHAMDGAVRLDLQGDDAKPDRFQVADHNWVVVVTTDNTFHEDGRLTETQSRTYHGFYASQMRASLAPMDAQQRQDWLLSNYQETVSDRTTPTFELTGLDDVSAPVVIRSTATYDNVFDSETFEFYSEGEHWLIYETATSKTDNEHHAYEYGGMRYLGQTRFHLPAGRTVQYKGAKIDFKSPFGTLRRSSRPVENRIHFTTDLTIPRRAVPVDQLDRFNALMDTFLTHSSLRFGFEPRPE